MTRKMERKFGHLRAAYDWLTYEEGWMVFLAGAYIAAVAATLVSFLYVLFLM